jgi:hypothetical protein
MYVSLFNISMQARVFVVGLMILTMTLTLNVTMGIITQR